jgi:hypothetical protein
VTPNYLALPDGTPRYRANQLTKRISAKWKAMSKEEQEDATDQLLKELNEFCDMKKLAVQNVPINAFHDTQVTVKKLEDEVISYLPTNTSCAHRIIVAQGSPCSHRDRFPFNRCPLQY